MQNTHFYIVGIGASAGGLNAFKKLLSAIPSDSGMAYVLVQHLAPGHESLLPELLSKIAKIPVLEISNDIDVAANHIYVIPENNIVTASGSQLRLTPRGAPDKQFLPIDIFFKSLAEVYKSFAIGIVLSGTGFDGTDGLRSIKEHGGVTLAQDPASAEFSEMPLNAIIAETADFVLSPEKMAAHLVKIRQFYRINHANNENDILPSQDEEIYRRIMAILKQNSGHDFYNYKQATIRRRIAKRMAVTDKNSLSEYLKFLRNTKEEQEALFNDVLIPVTYFFRDPAVFHELMIAVFPVVFKNKTQSDTARVWIAGCSTGEEAYSLAICIHEYLSDKVPGIKVQVFATDIAPQHVARARTGIYTKHDVRNLSPDRLKRYFIRQGNGFQVSKMIREMCVFAVHNFLKDPPFGKMDIVSCRNVFIYLDNILQKIALGIFHYALNFNGVLLLGKEESAVTAPELFELQFQRHKIYIRKAIAPNLPRAGINRENRLPLTQKMSVRPDAANEFLKEIEGVLLSKYTPPGVIINSQLDAVHFHGNLAMLLKPPQGKPSLNILKMIRSELAFELRKNLQKSIKAKSIVYGERIPIAENEGRFSVCMEITPVQNHIQLCFLIIFKVERIVAEVDHDKDAGTKKTAKGAEQARIKQLENELAQLREDIRAVTNDQEVFSEELQSANEELLSGSEELQSVNEELETSREELQASNEELQSLNQELLDRHEQLFAVRTYAEAIVNAINEPIILLDKYFSVKNANTAFYNFFNTSEAELEGKAFSALNNDQWDISELRLLLEGEIKERKEFKNYEITIAISKKGPKILLLSARVINDISGQSLIMLVIQDITDTRVITRLKESEERFRLASELSGLGTWDLNLNTRRIINSPKIREIMGIEDAECTIDDFFRPIVHADIKMVQEAFDKADREEHLFFEARIQQNGRERWIRVNGHMIRDNMADSGRLLGTLMDVTEQKNFSLALESQVKERTLELKKSHELLKEKNRELERSNQELASFSYVASHDLHEPLRKIQTFTNRILSRDKQNLSEESRDYFDRLINASKRMTQLIDDILDFSKVNHTDRPLESVNLNGVVDSVINEMRNTLEEKQTLIEVDALPTLQIIPVHFTQLFSNLISNAVKYSRTNTPPHIKIHARVVNGSVINAKNLAGNENKKKFHEISVSDNGIGFEQIYEHKIFEMFQRLHSKIDFEGTGIGLAICKKIIQHYNGYILAEGKPGIGSTFKIYLPVKPV